MQMSLRKILFLALEPNLSLLDSNRFFHPFFSRRSLLDPIVDLSAGGLLGFLWCRVLAGSHHFAHFLIIEHMPGQMGGDKEIRLIWGKRDLIAGLRGESG